MNFVLRTRNCIFQNDEFRSERCDAQGLTCTTKESNRIESKAGGMEGCRCAFLYENEDSSIENEDSSIENDEFCSPGACGPMSAPTATAGAVKQPPPPRPPPTQQQSQLQRQQMKQEATIRAQLQRSQHQHSSGHSVHIRHTLNEQRIVDTQSYSRHTHQTPLPSDIKSNWSNSANA